MMKELNPTITCQDGFTMSVQGSEYNYSTPREDNPPNGYTHVECGFPSSTPVTSALLDYAECGTERETVLCNTVNGVITRTPTMVRVYNETRKQLGNCYNEYTCNDCGISYRVDSSG